MAGEAGPTPDATPGEAAPARDTDPDPTRGLPSLDLHAPARLLVLTGAGVSAESGLRTFRDSDGLWESHRVEDVATPGAFARDPALVWSFYAARRSAAAAAEPNAAHRALAACEERLGDRFLLVTQNVDGLHARAGSRRVLEIHGSLWRTRCSGCGRPPFEDRTEPTEPPRCDRCGGLLRPDIVWFGEQVDLQADHESKAFMKHATWDGARLVFLAIGTSGAVWPASSMVRYASDQGADTWLANLAEADNAAWFHHQVLGPATATVPALLGV